VGTHLPLQGFEPTDGKPLMASATPDKMIKFCDITIGMVKMMAIAYGWGKTHGNYCSRVIPC